MSSPIEHRHLQRAMLHVDEVSIAQLLSNIDEASVTSGPVELFRLCLNAQHMLVQMHGIGNVTQTEAALLVTYRSMSDVGRDYLRGMGEQLRQSFPRQRPMLTLVQAGDARQEGDDAERPLPW